MSNMLYLIFFMLFILLSCIGYASQIYTIPKIVVQTYKSYDILPECVKSVIEENKKNNPDYTFVFFDDSQLENYIKTHSNKKTYEAFKLINSNCGACKADFFRYVIIYNQGGIYADVKTRFKTNLTEWIHKDNTLRLSLWPWSKHKHLDKWFTSTKPKSDRREINQAFMVFPKKHPLLKKVIDNMVNRIYDVHKFGKKGITLDVTGPWVYTKSIAPFLDRYNIELMESGGNLYNGNVQYDGTKGCYHKNESKRPERYTKIKTIINK